MRKVFKKSTCPGEGEMDRFPNFQEDIWGCMNYEGWIALPELPLTYKGLKATYIPMIVPEIPEDSSRFLKIPEEGLEFLKIPWWCHIWTAPMRCLQFSIPTHADCRLWVIARIDRGRTAWFVHITAQHLWLFLELVCLQASWVIVLLHCVLHLSCCPDWQIWIKK